MPTTATTRYFDALAAANDVTADALRATGATFVQTSQRLLDETQQAQRRTLELTRRLVENPADVAGNVAAVIEANAEAQARAFGLTREWFDAAPERRAEAERITERIATANRELIQASLAAGRDLYTATSWLRPFGATA